ncbi:MAG: rhodanese-like domain-containing protein, partial [Verrucomicrobiota bacterium]
MKKSTAIAFGIIVGVAVLLLGLGQCGYNKLEEYQTLENVTAAVRQDFPNVEHITPNVLALLSQSESAPLLVDVREPEEYAVSRIPGAIRLPDAEAIQNHIGTLEEKPESIVVYCSVGRRSAAVAEGL